MDMSLDLSSHYLHFKVGMAKACKQKGYAFGGFRLDCDKKMLYRGEAEISLPPKVIETLTVLVENHGAIVSKAELMEQVWADSVVEESNLSQHLYLLRKTLGDGVDGRPMIETLRRRGYRFNGEVTLDRGRESPAAAPEAPEPALPRGAVEREGNVLRIVDWAPPQPSLVTIPHPPAGPLPKPKRPRLRLTMLGVVAAGIVAIGGGMALLWPALMPVATGNEPNRELSVTRLTNGAWANGATISRDGNYFVYHETDGETARMFVQQPGQNSRVEILSLTDEVFHAKSFSPDGRWIYYYTAPKGESPRSIFRIPTIGGPPAKIIENGCGSISFSPDGSEIAFCRRDAESSSILIADKDGRSERLLLQRPGPLSVYTGAAWSPDGKWIAFTERSQEPPGNLRLRLVSVSNGEVKPFSDEDWGTAYRIEWVPDGSGVVMIATRKGETLSIHRDQVYFVRYPDGRSQRITSDGNRHDTISLGVTKDGAVIAVPGTRSCQIWSMNANGDAGSAVQITRGSADGRPGLVSLPGGRIAYIARTGERLTVWVAKDDGTDAKQLATGFDHLEELRADPQGKFLVFSATEKQGMPDLFRISPDGTGLTALTSDKKTNETYASVSPDGTTVAVASVVYDADVPRRSLLKLPVGGGEAKLLPVDCDNPAFSPDGALIACPRNDYEIVIRSAYDGNEIERHRLPPFSTANFGTSWTPDGKGLIVIRNEKSGLSNLVVIPRDGEKPYHLTNFLSGVIYRYAFAHNGSRLFLARGYPTADAVLISNYR